MGSPETITQDILTLVLLHPDGFKQVLTLVLLNCFKLFFIHLKLELLTQFPASNDEKNITIYEK